MATITKQLTARAGITPSYAAASAGGDEFVNTGREIIHIKNGDASPHTVTIATPGTVDGLAIADRDVVVTNAEERIIGPFAPGTYNDATGKVQLTYDAETSVTLAVFQIGAL